LSAKKLVLILAKSAMSIWESGIERFLDGIYIGEWKCLYGK